MKITYATELKASNKDFVSRYCAGCDKTFVFKLPEEGSPQKVMDLFHEYINEECPINVGGTCVHKQREQLKQKLIK